MNGAINISEEPAVLIPRKMQDKTSPFSEFAKCYLKEPAGYTRRLYY